MALRTFRERVFQTFLYEIGGLALVTPVYSALFDVGAADSLALMAVLSVAVLAWSPLHNAAFDLAEWRLARRVASDRPHGLRVLHAVSHETTTIVVTVPLIMLFGGHGFWEALAIDVGLTVFYAAYAYLFFVAYDRLRPLAPAAAPPVPDPAQ
ncbi:MAG: PACE efflux transporter [Rubrimonas sp.]|uniref:PACE efflux transporter n=1 Tax=Rubrimonas sp. TaxID=2036015 RepID=UPI002FDC7E00